MDSVIFALGIFVGGMISCVLVLNVGIAGAVQGFAFLGAGVGIVLAVKVMHGWNQVRQSERRLQQMAEKTA